MSHRHVFEKYDPRTDMWVCACGASADRHGTILDADGRRDGWTLPKGGNVDPGVKSGRELLSC